MPDNHEENLPKRLLTAEDEENILAFFATAKKLATITSDLEEAGDKLRQSDIDEDSTRLLALSNLSAIYSTVIVLAQTLEIMTHLLPVIKLLLERTEIISVEEEEGSTG